MRRKRGKKPLIGLLVSLVMLSALLGTSYARWSKSIVVVANINSGDIDAKEGNKKTNYTMCTNIRCNSYNHHQPSTIKIKVGEKSIPITIRSVKLLSFEYYAESWRQDNEVIGYDWWGRAISDWVWHMSGSSPVVLNESQLKNVTFLETPRLDKNNELTLNIKDDDIKNAMPIIWDTDRPWFKQDGSYVIRPAHVDIDVTQMGKIKIQINYTQFNTPISGGWEKSIEVEVPVNWYRLTGWSNEIFPQGTRNQSIVPGTEGQYDY